MAYSEDIKRIFQKGDGLFSGSEITFFTGGATVVSGHKGICSLSSEQVVVRVKNGLLKVVGQGLTLQKASPLEAYISGRITAVVLETSYAGEIFQ